MHTSPKMLPFNVIHDTNSGIDKYKYRASFFCLYISIQNKNHGNNENASISGFKTNLRTIEIGKKFKNNKVINMVEFSNL